jgi:hypothetical protein
MAPTLFEENHAKSFLPPEPAALASLTADGEVTMVAGEVTTVAGAAFTTGITTDSGLMVTGAGAEETGIGKKAIGSDRLTDTLSGCHREY